MARLEPENPDVYSTRGLAFFRLGEHEKAMADYARAIELDPGHAVARNNRGYAFAAQRQFDRAAADYQEAIRLDPNHPNAYKNLAWLMATCRDASHRSGQAAVEHATKALELTEWKQGEWIEILAAAYAGCGDFAQAVKWQCKAVDAAEGETRKAELRRRLDLFRSGRPYREPA